TRRALRSFPTRRSSDLHETVEYVPGRFVVHVQRREKVACKNKDCPGEAVTAERTCPSALPTRVGASVLAHLVESKCDDSLPIYRSEEHTSELQSRENLV